MVKKAKAKHRASAPLLAKREPDSRVAATEKAVHVYGKKVRCDTDSRGHATPGNAGPLRIVVDASQGFIPLWEAGVTLRWRFKQASLDVFDQPAAVAARVEELLGESLLEWGDAVPVKFSKVTDNHDFQIVIRENDDCDINGCVLASAFFPDSGRHELVIYPQMFLQSEQEQIETMCHELGHVFGLRHFFAQISETSFPSQVFGTHDKFTIMNYGANSRMTDADRSDLFRLYDEVWSGARTNINGTPIRLFKPFSAHAAMVNFPLAAAVRPEAVSPAVYGSGTPPHLDGRSRISLRSRRSF